MKVRAIINFNDMEAKEKRIAGESVWECTPERANYLLDNNAVEILEGIKEDKKESKEEIKEVEAPKEAKEIKKPRKAKVKKEVD